MTLPIPDHNALSTSEKLIELIRQEIDNAGGVLSFARFMELALYAPGLGYYTAGTHKFGQAGDFVTAPEITPLFAQCLARQCQPIFAKLGTGDLLELGAGSGKFAKDFLLESEKLNCLPQHYYILEVSAELRERQKQLLIQHCPHLIERIIWLDTLPSDFCGVIFANEVMDAMPVHCFQITNTAVKERCVRWDNDHFVWHLSSPTSPELSTRFIELQQEFSLPNGYQSEINLMIKPWIASLAETLKKGVIFLFDYGYDRREYYRPDRHQGTLKCFYGHHHHNNPFVYIGLQDITAHIDFTTVVASAVTQGLSLAGYSTQAAFLLSCGLVELAATKTLSVTEQYQQSQAIKMLTLPSEMGELIKVMGLAKELDIPLIGFSLQDRRRDL
ncbi:MAG: class I SAM-dependent methyltransferase [Gammaproteobacteria bacterium]